MHVLFDVDSFIVVLVEPTAYLSDVVNVPDLVLVDVEQEPDDFLLADVQVLLSQRHE